MITAISTDHPAATDSLHTHMNRHHTNTHTHIHTVPSLIRKWTKAIWKASVLCRMQGKLEMRMRGSEGPEEGDNKRKWGDMSAKKDDYCFIKEVESFHSTWLCVNSRWLLLCMLEFVCAEKHFADYKKSLCLISTECLHVCFFNKWKRPLGFIKLLKPFSRDTWVTTFLASSPLYSSICWSLSILRQKLVVSVGWWRCEMTATSLCLLDRSAHTGWVETEVGLVGGLYTCTAGWQTSCCICICSNMCKLLSNPPQSASPPTHVYKQAGRCPSQLPWGRWVRFVRGGMVRGGCMCSLCQMPFVNKQGVLRGAPGVLTHPSRRTQSGCPPLPCVRGKEGGKEKVWSVCAWRWHRRAVGLIH